MMVFRSLPRARCCRSVCLFQNLEKHVHDIGMRLLNFVKEHHGVGLSANLLRQLSTLLITDVAWRRATRRDTVNFSMYSLMSSWMRDFSSPTCGRQRFWQVGFCPPRWDRVRQVPWDDEDPSSRLESDEGLAQSGDAFFLGNDA